MKKTIILMLVLIIAFASVSCDPDKGMENKLTGTWRIDGTDYYELQTFGSDGWWELEYYENGVLKSESQAKWSVDGDRIVLEVGIFTDYMKFSLDGDILVLDGETYRRVKQ